MSPDRSRTLYPCYQSAGIGAAAKDCGEAFTNHLFCGVKGLLQDSVCQEYSGRSTETAGGVLYFQETFFYIVVFRSTSKPFDGNDLTPMGGKSGGQAGENQLVVQEHEAVPAMTMETPLLGPQ